VCCAEAAAGSFAVGPQPILVAPTPATTNATTSRSGAAYVINKHLGATWLWDRVRVSGGAYGGFCDFDPHSGMFSFLSYRDPNLPKTARPARCGPGGRASLCWRFPLALLTVAVGRRKGGTRAAV